MFQRFCSLAAHVPGPSADQGCLEALGPSSPKRQDRSKKLHIAETYASAAPLSVRGIRALIEKYSTKSIVIFVVSSAFTTYISLAMFGREISLDFLAIYLAAEAFHLGQYDQIYPSLGQYFVFSSPGLWSELISEREFAEVIPHPYIYPPLWAAVVSPLTDAISPEAFMRLGFWINPTLICASSLLSWRIANRDLGFGLWIAIGLILALTTFVGFAALQANQAQIFLSFIILLAFERALAGQNKLAGMLLALAAAIKIYPVLFILIWISGRNWVALRSFALTGTVLVLLSLMLGGIELNQRFLATLSLISDTSTITNFSFNLSSYLSFLQHPDLFGGNPAGLEEFSEINQTYSFAKPTWVSVVNFIFLVCGLVLIWFRSTQIAIRDHPLIVWPALFILVSLTSPLSWSYHYLTVIFLTPALLTTWGKTRGLAIILLFLLPNCPLLLISIRHWISFSQFYMLQAGTLGVIVLFLGFACAPLRAYRV